MGCGITGSRSDGTATGCGQEGGAALSDLLRRKMLNCNELRECRFGGTAASGAARSVP